MEPSLSDFLQPVGGRVGLSLRSLKCSLGVRWANGTEGKEVGY